MGLNPQTSDPVASMITTELLGSTQDIHDFCQNEGNIDNNIWIFCLSFQGTASAKEFYKRNHQWTEGLISAAKAVGMGAKFLLTAADKVVSGQGKFEQLVVASQEIAASTAQLVVASRVKADRNSQNMSALSKASKGVTQATGGVVATAKSCSQMVEENGKFHN